MADRVNLSAGRIMLGRRPEHVPKAYWQRLAGLRWFGLLYVIGWGGYGLSLFVSSLPKSTSLAFWLVCGAMIFLFSYAPQRIYKRLRREVISNDFRTCIQCGYSLRALPDEHRCPECGVEYAVADLERAWKKWFSNKKED